ncbi:RNase adapter RapZ [Ramlibacter solisilvae]|uniref:Nucleotide-binding protein n=1 Tax=Ramlibacter tataouinensis TaxID=94132 RepID=A0A127JS82_9BURK|nr:RNase adapter RapZ [Ramlibacter tataouinensis]AMO22753.1 nucleotide-binding protein [Ramlibacter tataouinensis]
MTLEVVLITGMSGSGKSVALHALEDAGYYCVDNLPPELLQSFVALEQQTGAERVAIAIDVRSATSLPLVPRQLREFKNQGVKVRPLFLDATTETLVRRFSETRRRHPLSGHRSEDASHVAHDRRHALVDAIELERELLSDLREQAHVLDTSVIRPSQLQAHVKSLLSAPISQLTLVFESFAFKRGIPVDADYVFDVRMLPNPHYEPALKDLTGRDEPVVKFLEQHADVERMYSHIEQFLNHWLEPLARDHRSYVTVAIGCTGGQHRSVFLVEKLARSFGERWITLKRHRELDAVAP